MRRRIERSVHSGERAASVSDSWIRRRARVSTAAAAGVRGSTPGRRAARGPDGRGRSGCGSCPRASRAAVSTAEVGGGGARRRRLVRRSAGGSGGVAVEVEVLQRHAHAALAVGDRVVHLRHQRRLAAAQPLDDGELPQRPGAIERVERRSGWPGRAAGASVPGLGRAMRRTCRSMSKSGSSTHVGAPGRRVPAAPAGAGAARPSVARSMRRAQVVEVGGPVEDADGAEGRRQVADPSRGATSAPRRRSSPGRGRTSRCRQRRRAVGGHPSSLPRPLLRPGSRVGATPPSAVISEANQRASRRARPASVTPTASPATTSDAWWMRT